MDYVANVGFIPPADLRFNAADVRQVRKAAQHTAADGAAFAETLGFRVRSLAVESAPSWKGIVEVADRVNTSLIVLASYSRRTLADVLFTTVARDVRAHARRPVLVIRQRT